MATRGRIVLSLLLISCLMAPLMASSAPADKSNNLATTTPPPSNAPKVEPTDKVQPKPAAPADKPAAHNHARLKSARYRRTKPSANERALLSTDSTNAATATKQWGSTLMPHGDHYDRVAVYDTTSPYAGYHSAYGNFGGWGRKLSQATDSEQAEPIADAEGDDNESGKRALLATDSANAATATKQWGSTLVPHGDHYDRVPVYDTTSPYAGYHSAYGNTGGGSLWGALANGIADAVLGGGGDLHDHDHHDHGRKLAQADDDNNAEREAEVEPSAYVVNSAADKKDDNNESANRRLLAADSATAATTTNHWGSYWGSTTLVPHGDHYDRVPVYGGYYGHHHGWGRKLSQATDSEQGEPIDAEGDNNESRKRNLLAADSATTTKQWGSTLIPHGDHYDRVAVYDTTSPYAGYHSAYGTFGGHGHNHGWGRKMLR